VLFLIASYLLLVFVLPVALSAVVSYRALPRGRDCPHCRGDTIPLVAPKLRALAAMIPFSSLERRWCLCCGWEGTTRISRTAHGGTRQRERFVITQRQPEMDAGGTDAGGAGVVPGRAAPDQAGEPDTAVQPIARPSSTQTLDVRSLDLDGTAWRVMIQCWHSTGLYYGRFIFLGPTGRLWLDAVESFTGSTESEVLGQAQSLPEGMLASRLRRLVANS
jgi:hypothetical protein